MYSVRSRYYQMTVFQSLSLNLHRSVPITAQKILHRLASLVFATSVPQSRRQVHTRRGAVDE